MQIWKQGSGRLIVIFFALLAATAVAADRREWDVTGEEGGGGGGWNERTPFLLRKSEVVMKTKGGEIRVFRGQPWNGHPARLKFPRLRLPRKSSPRGMRNTCLSIQHLTPLKASLSTAHLKTILLEREMEKWKPGSGRVVLIFFALLSANAVAEDRREWEVAGEEGGGGGGGGGWVDERAPFLIKNTEVVTKTEGGEIRVFRSRPWNGRPARLHVGLVTMEPNTMIIPHYMDADLIFFLIKGEAKIGWIHGDELVDRRLKPGDILRVPAGSTFYVVNTGKDQRLQIINSVQPVGAELIPKFTAFFIGGGVFPPSVFAGFDITTITSALNNKSARYTGSIIFITSEEANHHRQLTGDVSAMEKLKRSRQLGKGEDQMIEIEVKEEKRNGECTWKSILSSIFFGKAARENDPRRRFGDPVDAPEVFNIYGRDPDFKNDYGWSIEVNEHDYLPLKKSDISVFLVNLSAGSMMAPHVNPRATEYGVVIAGAGTVEVAHPNGTGAMKTEVKEGDVYWVPRFYPFVQVAARDQPMEILGFTTSARRNRPQFLAGKSSLLTMMLGKVLATGLGVGEDDLRQLVIKQKQSVILPSWEKTGG